jgi:hypothetical protein
MSKKGKRKKESDYKLTLAKLALATASLDLLIELIKLLRAIFQI